MFQYSSIVHYGNINKNTQHGLILSNARITLEYFERMNITNSSQLTPTLLCCPAFYYYVFSNTRYDVLVKYL